MTTKIVVIGGNSVWFGTGRKRDCYSHEEAVGTIKDFSSIQLSFLRLPAFLLNIPVYVPADFV